MLKYVYMKHIWWLKFHVCWVKSACFMSTPHGFDPLDPLDPLDPDCFLCFHRFPLRFDLFFPGSPWIHGTFFHLANLSGTSCAAIPSSRGSTRPRRSMACSRRVASCGRSRRSSRAKRPVTWRRKVSPGGWDGGWGMDGGGGLGDGGAKGTGRGARGWGPGDGGGAGDGGRGARGWGGDGDRGWGICWQLWPWKSSGMVF